MLVPLLMTGEYVLWPLLIAAGAVTYVSVRHGNSATGVPDVAEDVPSCVSG